MVFGVIGTVKGKNDIHFYSRFFAPWLGVNEDPVMFFHKFPIDTADISCFRCADLRTVHSHHIGQPNST